MAKKKYTSAQVSEITGLSKQTLSLARNGYKSLKGYEVQPRLKRGADWDWIDGTVIFFESSIEILKQSKKGRKRKNE